MQMLKTLVLGQKSMCTSVYNKGMVERA
ncbi:hypothetical protein RDABS01_032174 [Bienertia sinuspersici]